MKPILLLLIAFISTTVFSQPKGTPSVGDERIDFSLSTVQGNEIQLSELNDENPVVLVVLRGWPGYQCPLCTRQVGGLVEAAAELAKHDAKILMVYPGPSEQLQEHAREFSEEFDFPENFYFALDPDYEMINIYGLRWNAPKETAYPSTFVIDKTGKVVYAKISQTHGDRAVMDEIFEAFDSNK